ncbi:MAG: tRNA preQ1(34) S-adenosylmethionine ribosyltransferase-isomerase QueA [Chloroflexi bacterium]|nr:tRNA preQ1(34) S-adenosylmethionine ribosyltransferase-isomerase QueA [Chloroflexota bacterium]
MHTGDFDYHLPQQLIAQTPVEPRDHARLLVLDRASGTITHRRHFFEIEELLRPGDLLVLNDTRVLPARLLGRHTDTGGKVELLLLHRLTPARWRCLSRPARSLRQGSRLVIESADAATSVAAEVIAAEENGLRTVAFENEEVLERVGRTPLPPYIHTPLRDPERYQTVYARVKGSAAAPTAGLHFTPDLLERLQRRNVQHTFVTLHIGLDTFRPVQEEDPRQHKMHSEFWELSHEAAEAVNRAKREGRRVVAVGTSVVRLLEAAALSLPKEPFAAAHPEAPPVLQPASGWVDLLILPGHRFRVVDAMVTNFHLPRSTLLMLVSAFAGQDLVLRAYREAIARGYRFYSFGDANLVT